MPAWLFTILRNLFRSAYRKRRREVEDAEWLLRGAAHVVAGADRPP
jgi:DNA-directed RNA polymerase specialized sigma24 family protein